MTVQVFRCAHLLTPEGWLSPGFLTVDTSGFITGVSADRPGLTARAQQAAPLRGDSLSEAPEGRSIVSIDGFVLPGMPNLHSHAHQRGLAGRAERWVAVDGSTFWDWRARMYAFVNALSPEDLEAIAAQAYLELLKSGFTAVAEFHYLHNAPSGAPYGNPAELSERILGAADQTGIALTLLPSLYTSGGFNQPASPDQRRFIHTVDSFLSLFSALQSRSINDKRLRVGIAPHSLRAVPIEAIQGVVAEARRIVPDVPIHIHVAEQQREVDECLATLGRRPIEALIEDLPVDQHWTLIHATHHTESERAGILRRNAVVGLCPVTEANLGDGVFPLAAHDRLGGDWGVGTDANLASGVAEELRTLEYGQRLVHRRRDVLADPDNPGQGDPGHLLFTRALAGGARALAQPIGAIEPGRRADLVVLDPDHPSLAGHTPETALAAWLFTGNSAVVRDVMVAGHWLIQRRHHPQEDAIAERFRATMQSLTDRLP